LAYVLVEALRRLGLAGTEWAEAQADTIRLKLLKIAAQVRITAPPASGCATVRLPWQNVFAAAWTACAAEKEERIKPVSALPEVS